MMDNVKESLSHLQWMAVTPNGSLMARVQRRVEEERKLASEPAQIHLQQMVERTAVVLDLALQAKNAKSKSVLVSAFSNLGLQLLLVCFSLFY